MTKPEKKIEIASYELNLHWKQGDDFARHIEQTKTIPEALRSWGEQFRALAGVCDEIAEGMKSCDVDVCADTHMISFMPKNIEARQKLEALVNEELLTKIVDEVEDEDEIEE